MNAPQGLGRPRPRAVLALQEFCRYLLYLRIPLLLVTICAFAFISQQVCDVLLAMALEPHWGAFATGALFAVVFGVLEWLSARALTDLRWMRPPSGTREARPRVQAMAPGVIWWYPRLLGITPLLLFAAGMGFVVGDVGSAPVMVLLLLFLAAVLLVFFVQRTRAGARVAAAITFPLLKAPFKALTLTSGRPGGLFSPRTELVLMVLAWMNLALISVPIARAAYGSFGGGVLHLYVLLLAGALLIALWRRGDQPPRPRAYWVTFAGLVVAAAMLPLVVQALPISGVLLPRLLGAIAILFLASSIFLVFGSTFFAFGVQTGIPLVSLLLVTTLVLNVFRINDNHALRILPSRSDAVPSALPTLSQRFAAWIDEPERAQLLKERPADRPFPIYVVSAQGGGVYAAYHAAKALALLDREVPQFHQHLFTISGVSGGSVGAVLYANALDSAGDNMRIVDRVDAAFEPDHLSPVLAAMLFGDMTQRAYPFRVPAWDRALGLELAFETTPGISLTGPFHASQDPADNQDPGGSAAGRPFLVLNATAVQDGRRFLFAPFRFRSDAVFHDPRPLDATAATRSGESEDVRFSTAAVLSARFPLISPYGFFAGSPERVDRRYVDGGYYDNSGAVTAQEVVDDLQRAITDKGLKGQVEVIPIAIVNRSAFPSSPSAAPPRARIRPLFGFSSIDALFASREARVDKTLNQYGIRCGFGSGADPSLCITLEQGYHLVDDQQPRTIPLGWTLSCQARAAISRQLEPVAGAVASSEPPCMLEQQGRKMVSERVAGEPRDGIPSFAAIVARVRHQIATTGP